MHSNYKNLFLESIIHFLIMFTVMYTMVDTLDDIYININNIYMTGMMISPMIILMIVTMKSMYPNKKLNLLICFFSLLLFISFYAFERNQSFVGDKQFIRSMIPHHSGAILMCNKSQIMDSELRILCEKISAGQRKEIDQMKSIFKRLNH